MALSSYLSTHVSFNWFSLSFFANLTIADGLCTFRWYFACFVKVVLRSVLNSWFNLLNISFVRSFKINGSMSPFCFAFILLLGFFVGKTARASFHLQLFKHAWQSNILCGVFRSFKLCQFPAENTPNKCIFFCGNFFPRIAY